MKTYRVYLGRPETEPPMYNFSQNVLAPSASTAAGKAYQTWFRESRDVPEFTVCRVSVHEVGEFNQLTPCADPPPSESNARDNSKSTNSQKPYQKTSKITHFGAVLSPNREP